MVNADLRYKEEIVVHELLHLVMRKEGFPLFSRTGPLPPSVDPRYFGQLLTEVNEAVLHRVIFHRMQALDFRPALAMLPLLAARAGAESLNDLPYHGAVVNYARALLESDDPKIQALYVERYLQNGWADRLQHGEELADYLRPWSDFTKEQAGERFIGSLNRLFRGVLSFTAEE